MTPRTDAGLLRREGKSGGAGAVDLGTGWAVGDLPYPLSAGDGEAGTSTHDFPATLDGVPPAV